MTFSALDSEKLFTELAALSDAQFVIEFKVATENERHAIVRTCHFINELERRRCFALVGAPSAFEYLTKVEGYSEGSANRRIQTARYLRLLPAASEKIASGELSMDAIATVQRAVRQTEKETGVRVSAEAKADLLQRVENKSSIEAKKLMAEEFLQLASARAIIDYKNQTEARVHLTLPVEVLEKYQRIAELLSHQTDSSKLVDVLDAAAEKLLSLIDPLKKEVKARPKRNPKTSSIAPADRNFVLRRDNGECQATLGDGLKCKSRHQIEIDHVTPRALGGSSRPENLRCLCRKHNFQAAEEDFGREHMAPFLRAR